MPEVFSSKKPATKSKKTASHSKQSTSHSSQTTHAHSTKTHVHPGGDKPHRHVDEYSEVMNGEHASHNPFRAFAAKPVRTSFESQSATEQLILVLRKHPITNLPWIIIAILMFFAPFALSFFPLIAAFPVNFQIVTLMAWYLLVIGFVLESFLSWFFNINIITDERIIDVDFENLIYKRVSSAKIDNIEDVTSSTGGFIRSLLRFGTVIVQTAGEAREFEFVDVPQPEKVVKLINEMILEEEREQLEGRVS